MRIARRFIEGLVPCVLVVATAADARAQQATVSGRVIERGSRAAIPNATVALEGRTPVLTGNDGSFRFAGLPVGRYGLTVQAIGWSAEDIALVVHGDTTLVIELDRAPVQLDTLGVEARNISIRGVIRDSATALELIDVEVSGGGRTTKTDPIGRFRLKDVPRNTPYVLRIEELGYLPVTMAVVASEDTTLDIRMRPDRVVLRMMENAKQRLAERSGPRSYKLVPTITRDVLLRHLNRSVLDVLNEELRARNARVSCYVIDERVSSIGKDLLETMMPDRVEHIEVLEFGQRDYLMVRVFTRDYFPSVMVRSANLMSREQLMRNARSGNCR